MTALARRESRPTCAVCGKPVDRFERWDEDFVGKIYFLVTCHGRTEKVRVDYDDIRDAKSITFGLAFATEQRRLT